MLSRPPSKQRIGNAVQLFNYPTGYQYRSEILVETVQICLENSENLTQVRK